MASMKETVLAPYAIDETFVFLESCVWQAPPSPNLTRIMTPKNSAAGSRMYSLGAPKMRETELSR